MKQHITVEQFNELTQEQKEKLRDWWTPQYSDLVIYYSEGYKPEGQIFSTVGPTKDWPGDRKLYPCLSIGQMIEFMDEKYTQLEILKGGLSKRWYVEDHTHPQKDRQVSDYSTELCDELWKIVKEVLSK